MKRLNHISFILFIAITSIILGCASEEEECPDVAIPNLRLTMKQPTAFGIDSVIIFNDSLAENLFQGTAAPDCLTVPLNLSADTTILNFRFTIIADSTRKAIDTLLKPYLPYFIDSVVHITDEVSFVHTRGVKLNNLECDFITEFALHKIYFTHQIIDSIYIYDTIINSVKKDHVTIYY